MPRSAPQNLGELLGLAQRLEDLAVRWRGADDELARDLTEMAALLRRFLASVGHGVRAPRRRI